MLARREITAGRCYVDDAGKLAREVLRVQHQTVTYNQYDLTTGKLRGAPHGEIGRSELIRWASREATDEECSHLQRAEVRDLFRASKIGVIAGCHVTQGKVTRSARARLVREGTIVYEGTLSSLKRFKDDAREVEQGFECGITLTDFQDVKVGDVIEAYETRKVDRKLD